jgi:hypothetical protein
MLKVVDDPAEPNLAGGSSLDEIVRDGARQMLAAALHAEGGPFVEAHRGEVDEGAAGWWSATATTCRGSNNGGGVRCGCGTRGSTTSASMR